MPYTTHGYMTAADMAEIRADYDLDLCPCCEGEEALLADDELCERCGHASDGHNGAPGLYEEEEKP